MRPAAEAIGVPHTTARGWVRRFYINAQRLAVAFAALCVDLGADAPRPASAPMTFALGAITAAWRAAGALPGWMSVDPWRFCSSVCGGWLLVDQHEFALVGRRQTSFHASCPMTTRRDGSKYMDDDQHKPVALHRWAVIAEATSDRLGGPRTRSVGATRSPSRSHTHPDGSVRRYSRGTIDRWIRAWRTRWPRSTSARDPLGHWSGACTPRARGRGRGTSPRAADALGCPDRRDPLCEPRDPSR